MSKLKFLVMWGMGYGTVTRKLEGAAAAAAQDTYY